MKRPWTTLLVLWLPLHLVWGHPGAQDHLSGHTWNRKLSVAIQTRLHQTPLPLPVLSDRQVLGHIRAYLTRGRRDTERILGRAQGYFPVFEHYLRLYGLPVMLKYLPMVESRLLPRAESVAGAAGLWQFMPATAKAYGLEIDEWRDDRLDPYRASEAAARLLSDLYAQFDDWALALAAYNCGPGRVERAIRLAGSRRPADVLPFLPGQTRSYLPQLIAAYYIGEFGAFHGLQAELSVLPAADLRLIQVDRKLSFRQVAAVTGLSYRQIARWNPALRKQYVPGHLGESHLLLPHNAALRLRQYIRQTDHFPPFISAGVIPTFYTVASGDRIEDLACLFNCSVKEIMDWNDLQRPVLAVHQEIELRLCNSFWLQLV